MSLLLLLPPPSLSCSNRLSHARLRWLFPLAFLGVLLTGVSPSAMLSLSPSLDVVTACFRVGFMFFSRAGGGGGMKACFAFVLKYLRNESVKHWVFPLSSCLGLLAVVFISPLDVVICVFHVRVRVIVYDENQTLSRFVLKWNESETHHSWNKDEDNSRNRKFAESVVAVGLYHVTLITVQRVKGAWPPLSLTSCCYSLPPPEHVLVLKRSSVDSFGVLSGL